MGAGTQRLTGLGYKELRKSYCGVWTSYGFDANKEIYYKEAEKSWVMSKI